MLTLLVPQEKGKTLDVTGDPALLIMDSAGLMKCKIKQPILDYEKGTFSGTLHFEGIPFKAIDAGLVANSVKQASFKDMGSAIEYIITMLNETTNLLFMYSEGAPAAINAQMNKIIDEGQKKKEAAVKAAEEKTDDKQHTVKDKRISSQDAPSVAKAAGAIVEAKNVKTAKVETKMTPVDAEVEKAKKTGDYPAKDKAPIKMDYPIDKQTGGLIYPFGLVNVNAKKYDKAWMLGYLFTNSENEKELMMMASPELIPGDKETSFYVIFTDHAICRNFYNEVIKHPRLKKLLAINKDGKTMFEPMALTTIAAEDRDFEVVLVRSYKKFIEYLDAVPEVVEAAAK